MLAVAAALFALAALVHGAARHAVLVAGICMLVIGGVGPFIGPAGQLVSDIRGKSEPPSVSSEQSRVIGTGPVELAMPTEHSSRLKRIATSVHDAVLRGDLPSYEESGRSDPYLRTMFHLHFPEFDQHLTEYESLTTAEGPAKQAALRSVYEDGCQRWVRGDGWQGLKEIIEHGQSYTAQFIDEPPAADQSPRFAVSGNCVVLGTPGGGTVLRYLTGHEPDGGASYVADLKSWVIEMRSLPAVQHWRELRRRKAELQGQVADDLEPIMYAAALPASRCGPACGSGTERMPAPLVE